MSICKDSIIALKIVFICLRRISISICRAGILKIPEQVFAISPIVPIFTSIVSTSLFTALHHSEAISIIGVQILTIILQPDTDRTAGAGLSFTRKRCLSSDIFRYRDLIVRYCY